MQMQLPSILVLVLCAVRVCESVVVGGKHCDPGFFLNPETDVCTACSSCPPGQQPRYVCNGLTTSQTECVPCPLGTFSKRYDVESCAPHTLCITLGFPTRQAGNATHNTLCHDQCLPGYFKAVGVTGFCMECTRATNTDACVRFFEELDRRRSEEKAAAEAEAAKKLPATTTVTPRPPPKQHRDSSTSDALMWTIAIVVAVIIVAVILIGVILCLCKRVNSRKRHPQRSCYDDFDDPYASYSKKKMSKEVIGSESGYCVKDSSFIYRDAKSLTLEQEARNSYHQQQQQQSLNNYSVNLNSNFASSAWKPATAPSGSRLGALGKTLSNVSPRRLRSASETIFGTMDGKETILDLLQTKEPEEVLALKIELIAQMYQGLVLRDLSPDIIKDMKREMENLPGYVSTNLGRAMIDNFRLTIRSDAVSCSQLLTKVFKEKGSVIPVSDFLHFLHQYGDRETAETFCDLLIRWYRRETSQKKQAAASSGQPTTSSSMRVAAISNSYHQPPTHSPIVHNQRLIPEDSECGEDDVFEAV